MTSSLRFFKIAVFLISTVVTNKIYSQPCDNSITNLGAKSTNTISLHKTWNIYLYRPTFYKVPSLYTLAGVDTVYVSNTCATWTVADPAVASVTNGVVTAKNTGSTTLTATINGQFVSIPLQVNAEVKPAEFLSNIDPFLTTPAANSMSLVPVVVICFIPTDDGININTTEAAFSPIPAQTVNELQKHILKIHKHTKFSLEEGSKFRGYKDPTAIPYVGYKIIDYIYVYEPVPRGFKDPGSTSFFGDYEVILNRFNGKRYVDTLGVKEFWMMGYHNGDIVPNESNMSSPTTGDISNSYRFADDLPIYSKTYILYNYNFTREGNEATHNHGHQIETMVDYVAIRQDGSTNLFTRNFRGYNGGSGPIGRVGDTHHPPNTSVDYDYNNPTLVSSDILDWKPEGGTQTMVNNNTWGSLIYNWPQGTTPNVESNWYVLWLQSLPGYRNQIPYGTTNQMTNWWEFLSNWDNTSANIGLYQNTTILPVTFTSTKVYKKMQGVQVEWKVDIEVNIDRYEVERSANGSQFARAATLAAKNNGNIASAYDWFDDHAISANNFYRIKSVSKSGEVKYGPIVSINISKDGKEIIVYPNPATASTLNVHLNGNKGRYLITLTSSTGQQVYKEAVDHTGGAATQTFQVPVRLAAGVYQLRVVNGMNTSARQVIIN